MLSITWQRILIAKFDYVYIAPPQFNGLWKDALITIDSNPEWLSDDAWVIVQIHPVEYESLDMKHLCEFDIRSYGSTMLIFYQTDIPEHL
jgi:16S rRNA (guanine966-N2)-methyltransferase